MIETGIDIVEVARIKKSIQGSDRFTKRIFHKKEIEYCRAGAAKYQHYAVRFAVKEAARKILLDHIEHNILKWKSVWIENNQNGKPVLKFSEEILGKVKIKNCSVSLSHIKELAIASVVMEFEINN
ncbi:MAG: holo-ACP synthase [Candidatus Marinimicrobia bacterium]|nr:holo-ACP synthase [Candidatus Neomarinimicrobiota bacterium]